MSVMAHRNDGDGRCIWCHNLWPCYVAKICHELAEVIRAHAATAAMMRSERMQGRADGLRAAADLIDPEVP